MRHEGHWKSLNTSIVIGAVFEPKVLPALESPAGAFDCARGAAGFGSADGFFASSTEETEGAAGCAVEFDEPEFGAAVLVEGEAGPFSVGDATAASLVPVAPFTDNMWNVAVAPHTIAAAPSNSARIFHDGRLTAPSRFDRISLPQTLYSIAISEKVGPRFREHCLLANHAAV